MTPRWLHAVLGLSMFVVPAVFVLGLILEAHALAFMFVLFILPLARPVFGRIGPDDKPLWSERVATFLDCLPVLYAMVLPACIVPLLRQLNASEQMPISRWVGIGLR